MPGLPPPAPGRGSGALSPGIRRSNWNNPLRWLLSINGAANSERHASQLRLNKSPRQQRLPARRPTCPRSTAVIERAGNGSKACPVARVHLGHARPAEVASPAATSRPRVLQRVTSRGAAHGPLVMSPPRVIAAMFSPPPGRDLELFVAPRCPRREATNEAYAAASPQRRRDLALERLRAGGFIKHPPPRTHLTPARPHTAAPPPPPPRRQEISLFVPLSSPAVAQGRHGPPPPLPLEGVGSSSETAAARRQINQRRVAVHLRCGGVAAVTSRAGGGGRAPRDAAHAHCGGGGKALLVPAAAESWWVGVSRTLPQEGKVACPTVAEPTGGAARRPVAVLREAPRGCCGGGLGTACRSP
ncbi:sterile alpha motif domain-containing protein 1-like [Schistocerca nitens]|uniref:sterile alpha motif domain-containing protein 1-like n=1 Tax=Schistocerca nitens TaxID=7011 RepID=UPI002117EF4E|nr:sterile alpha motif domain-containing protein 1-like [Schistocerca nitens]